MHSKHPRRLLATAIAALPLGLAGCLGQGVQVENPVERFPESAQRVPKPGGMSSAYGNQISPPPPAIPVEDPITPGDADRSANSSVDS